MVVSFGIGFYIEGVVVVFVILFNVVVGFFQEYFVEKIMDFFCLLFLFIVFVICGSEVIVVFFGEFVFGDLVEVKMGDIIFVDIWCENFVVVRKYV